MTPFTIPFTAADLRAIAPEISLVAAGCLVLLVEAFAPGRRRWFATSRWPASASRSTFSSRSRSARPSAGAGTRPPSPSWSASSSAGRWSSTILVARPYLERTGEEQGEFYALLLWGHAGVSMMTRGLDLLIIFIGLETLSLAFYVLAGFFRRIAASSEAGLKYFLTGAFGSAFTLYGIALLFGASGGRPRSPTSRVRTSPRARP